MPDDSVDSGIGQCPSRRRRVHLSTASAQSGEPAPLTAGDTHTRRQLLKAGAVVGLVAGGGYALLQVGDDETSSPEKTRLGVPAGSFFVADVALARLLSDQTFQSRLDQEFESPDAEARGVAATLDAIESRTGIAPRDIDEATAFARQPAADAEPAGAALFDAGVDRQTVRNQLDGTGMVVDSTDYDGVEIVRLRDDAGWELSLCGLDSGTFAIGARRELEAVLDVRGGSRSPVGGPVVEAQDRADEEYLSFGFLVPESLLQTMPAFAQQVLGGADILSGHGTVDTEPPGQLTITVRTASPSHADDLASQLRLLDLLDSDAVQELIDLPLWMRYRTVGLLEELSVETDGSTVTVTLPGGFEVAALLLRAFLRERSP